MEEWSVPGTDSENEESPEKSASYVEFGGIRIPPSRLLELMQASTTATVLVILQYSEVLQFIQSIIENCNPPQAGYNLLHYYYSS